MGWIKVIKKPHKCDKPSEVENERQNITDGSQWQCDICGAIWTWKYYSDMRESGHYWDFSQKGRVDY